MRTDSSVLVKFIIIKKHDQIRQNIYLFIHEKYEPIHMSHTHEACGMDETGLTRAGKNLLLRLEDLYHVLDKS